MEREQNTAFKIRTGLIITIHGLIDKAVYFKITILMKSKPIILESMLPKLKMFVFLVLFLIGFSCKEKETSKETEKKSPPNIIIIMTDDQGYGDLGYHGNPYIQTPNLDSFAKEALELTNFHVGTTCAPTRAGLITGRNANRNNTWHTIAGCSILLEDEETIAEVFEANKYKTAMFGKWHLGDNYPFRPQDRGFKNAFYHGGGGVQQTPDYWKNDYFDDTYFRNGVPEKTNGYCTDVWFNEAVEYIGTTKESPFFMYLALNAAHSPFNVPEEYSTIYKDAPLTAYQKRFYGMVSNIDDNFGRLVEHLKKTGQYDNTILIFTTDNGTALGIAKNADGKESGYNAGLRGTKGSHYDGGHRVPFFISWPDGDILQRTTINELTAHVDLLPTLPDLAGLPFKAKKPLDGTSVANILRGKEQRLDRMLVVDTQRNKLPEKGRNSCTMSTDWRLIDGKELYNTKDDPGQRTNVAAQHPNIVSKMKTFYDDWWASVEPDVRYAEIPLGEEAANPILITVHDMHTSDNIPWNQVQIREGNFAPDGYYSIKVIEDGTYRFKLYRYAPESGLALNEAAKELEASGFRNGFPSGKIVQLTKAQVTVGEMMFESVVDANLSFVSLKTDLTKGSYLLKSNFIDSKGAIFPSYYTEITKY